MGIKSIKSWLKKGIGGDAYLLWQRIELEKIRLLQGKALANWVKTVKEVESFQEVEFSVFSQVGDDGIIQYLINKLNISNKTFIEFGVQDYIECNTRFLLMNNYWSGLVIDGSSDYINFIKKDYYFWKYDLKAIDKFITIDNINEIISSAGFREEIGLLHIDIDGNDYWIWDALHIVKPIIVIIEYNSSFGSERSITVPYSPDFVRFNAHYSGIYYGVSLKALIELGKNKGYTFIGCNSYGNDAYFIRNDHSHLFKEKNSDNGFIRSQSRQNRDTEGKLTSISDYEMIKTYSGLKVMNTLTMEIEELNK